ncbi:hypothetical protein GA0070616_0438 [Micromonospora nigra]|uniref:Uncharacterized protein n=1 Tax=Micromonospora nigra TaxID=145857 RepID=A0A1C6RBQ0_9ACTN|nr:hypothetical protein [Micromonospora nigra]SCL14430.1 hypothetical protein GA0070616_0438 [Micromonospora nigra]
MRWLALHLRCRGVPASAAAALAAATVLWWLGQATDVPRLRLSVALLTVLVATVAFGPGLTGADPALDRSAALAWLPRRAAHVLAIMATAAAVAAAPALVSDPLAAVALLVRDAAGFGGLLALGGVAWGAQWAWLLPAGWTLTVLLTGPASSPTFREVLTWMMQPPGTTSATVTAVAIGFVGVLAHAVLGGRR